MDVWGMTVAAFRRWYVLIPLLVISLAAAYVVGSRSQSDYEVTGAVMLVAPADNPVPSNPYAADSAVQILGIKAMSSSTRSSFVERGLSGDYEIEYDDDTPVMEITVVGESQEVALGTGQQLVKYLSSTLGRSQGELGVPRAARVVLTIVDAPDVVNPTEGGTVRVTAILAVLGIVVSFLIAVIVDAILARRRSLAQAKAAAEGEGTESEPQTSPDTLTMNATRVGPAEIDP